MKRRGGRAGQARQEPMISLEDCIAMCGLDEDEVAAIVEHEHVPPVEACAIASDLMHRPDGPAMVRTILVDDMRAAHERGDMHHAATLLATLRRFLHEHPEAGIASPSRTIH
jgi:hypothetical protein